MDGITTAPADRRPRAADGRPGPWVVEMNIAGYTIRRRAARRRYLLGRLVGLPARA